MDLDDFICTLCFCQYDKEEHLPLMIPKCGHTFCTKCVKEMISKLSDFEDFVCPEDKHSMRLLTKDISEFPQNLALLRLLDKKAASANNEKNSDSISREGQSIRRFNKSSSNKSPSSSQDFCSPIGSPRRNISMKNDFVQQDLLSFVHGEGNICKEHSRKMEVICLEDKCRICANCALFGIHRNHEIKPEDEVLREIAGRAERLVDIFQAMEKCQSVAIDQEWTDRLNDKTKRKFEEMTRLVRQKFLDYMNLLKLKERKILNDINMKFSQIKDRLSLIKQLPEDLQDQLGKWKSKTHESLLIVTEKSEKGEIAFELLEDRINPSNDLLISGEKLLLTLERTSESNLKSLDESLAKVSIVFDDNFSKSIEKLCFLDIPDLSFYKDRLYQKTEPREVLKPTANFPLSDIINKTSPKHTVFREVNQNKDFSSKSPMRQKDDSLAFEKDITPTDKYSSCVKFESINAQLGKKLEEDNNLLDFEWKDLNSEMQMIGNPVLVERGRAQINQRKSSAHLNVSTAKEDSKERDRSNNNINTSGRLSVTRDETQTTRRDRLALSGKKSSSRAASPWRKNPSDYSSKPPRSRKKAALKVSDKFEPIIDGIEQNTLDIADLTGAELGDQGVLALIDYLKENTTLKSLKLLKNKITDEGGTALANLLYFNKTLHTINLTQNQLTEKTLEAFIEAIQAQKSVRLKSLYVSQNLMSLRNVKLKLKELAELGVNTIL